MTSEPDKLIDALRNPAVWPDRPEQVECIETHISWVFLTRDFAWKIKKPVSFEFLDFTTLSQRKDCCDEELRLNRRTAPELYLDVVPICGSASDPDIGGTGDAIEFAVKMRRFNDTGLLARMAAEKRLTPALIDDLAETIAAFHAAIPRAKPDSRFGRPADIRQNAMDNFAAIEQQMNGDAACESVTGHLKIWTVTQADRLEQTFAQRLADGFVRECHGDLHLRNIVEIEGRPCLFDCIEFNAGYRWMDVISEIAFLVMDLEEHGESRLACRLLNRYLERTGDYGGLRVLRFYLVYRAMVRAKIDMLRLRERNQSAVQQRLLLHEFGGYLSIADHDAAQTPPVLLIMHGFSGSGKTAVSQRVVENSPAIRIRSDVERKRILGIDETARVTGAEAWRLYSLDMTRRTYNYLEVLARSVIEAGFPVIVDAAFLQGEERARFRRLADQLSVPFRIIACTAPEEELYSRVSTREGENRDASDAGIDALRQQLATGSGITNEPAEQLITVDTNDEAATTVAIDRICRLVA